MLFVLLAEHNAEVCPTSNATTRDLLLKIGPEVPSIAERAGVKIVARPYVNREHLSVSVVEADTADAVDDFIVGTRLHQWNRCASAAVETAGGGRERHSGRRVPV